MPRRIPKVAKRANRENPRIDRNPSFNVSGQELHKIKRVDLLPRNLAQEHYLDALQDDANDIVFAVGPAGSGKTLLCTQFAIQQLQQRRIDRIVITRPAVSNGEELGALPGTLIEKMAPWTRPLFDIFRDYYSIRAITNMLQEEIIEICPLGFMRGRAQPLDSIIQTPLGPRRMGDLSIGDTVLGSDGRNTEVTGIFPQGTKPIYKVSFSDGVSTLASGDHLWVTQTRNEKKRDRGFSVKSTEEIITSGIWKHNYRNHEVPMMSKPAEFSLDFDLPIDPYLLGALLGDGSMNDRASLFTTADAELVEAVGECLPETMKMTDVGRYNYRIASTRRTSITNPCKAALRKFGLSGCRSYEKFIPKEYIYARIDDRIALLQGLMDTDGTIWTQSGRAPRLQYASTSAQLAADVAWLVRSLGGNATVREREYSLEETRTDRPIHHRSPGHIVEICLPASVQPFRLGRKLQEFAETRRVFRFIDSIEKIGEMPCQCISVSADDHLYLTDDFIVTHNTLKHAHVIFDEAQNSSSNQMQMCLTRIGEGSRMFITGDLMQHDRGYDDNGLLDFITRLERRHCPGIAVCRFDVTDVERHPIIEGILRLYSDQHHDKPMRKSWNGNGAVAPPLEAHAD